MKKNRKKIGLFNILNTLLFIIAALVCVIPFIHIIAISFSSKIAANSGFVNLIPVDFNFDSYRFAFSNDKFIVSIGVTLKRIMLGYFVTMLFTIVTAYPLSKESKVFKWRTVYVWVLFFATLFTGGLIPTFMTVQKLGLINKIWALVLPGAVNVFNIILLLNFYRSLPIEIFEAAYVDGAGEFRMLWQIAVPLSKAAIATLSLFTLVAHWNSYFDGLIYMTSTEKYPLQTYLYVLIRLSNFEFMSESADIEMLEVVRNISERTFRAAQIVMASVPILCVYPFLQKYFTKGIVIGSVKG